MRSVQDIEQPFIGDGEWTQEVLQRLIDDKVEERFDLDYKGPGLLVPNNGDKITKAVSAMANAAGGVVIFGLSEPKEEGARHFPEKIEPVLRSRFSREALAQTLARIQPVIDGLRIYPVPVEGSGDEVVYVVVIPQSNTAHQATDRRYYYRNNDLSEPMQDYQIRDVMNRLQYPKLALRFEIHERSKIAADGTRYSEPYLAVFATNEGKRMAEHVNAILWIPQGFRPRLPEESLSNHKHREHGGYHHIHVVRNFRRERLRSAPTSIVGYFDPVLPGMSFRLARIRLDSEQAERKGLRIYWEAFADNAPVEAGSSGVTMTVRLD